MIIVFHTHIQVTSPPADEVAITMGRRLWVSSWKLSPILGTIFAERSGGFGAENRVCLDIDLLVYVEVVKIFFFRETGKVSPVVRVCRVWEGGKTGLHYGTYMLKYRTYFQKVPFLLSEWIPKYFCPHFATTLQHTA